VGSANLASGNGAALEISTGCSSIFDFIRRCLSLVCTHCFEFWFTDMAKPHRLIKKANHGSRPANAKARRAKRRKLRT
jgi:hypothetical protein